MYGLRRVSFKKLPDMMSPKFSDFLTPSPLVRMELIYPIKFTLLPFQLSAFLDSPCPSDAYIISGCSLKDRPSLSRTAVMMIL